MNENVKIVEVVVVYEKNVKYFFIKEIDNCDTESEK